jgi:hypothetical protein
VEHQATRFFVRIFVEMINAVGVNQGRTALDAVDFIALLEQEAGEISAILTGDARDESSFQEGVLLFRKQD